MDEHENWVWNQLKFNFKTWNLIIECQELDKATHRVGTNSMPQSPLRMEIQRIEIEYVICNTLKNQPKDEYSQDYGSIQNFIWQNNLAIEH